LTAAAREALRKVLRDVERLITQHDAKKEYGKDICISLNPPGDMTIEQLFDIAQEGLAEWLHVVEITHSQSAVDITPQGVNKASALNFLSDCIGITPTEMLGIGDSQGDLSMLRLVGMPTTPANGTRDVRAIVRFTARRVGALGVADILRQFTKWR
jgi:hydroxymethylpyrimidine pyrophosphatase-like HAD family hydrolase